MEFLTVFTLGGAMYGAVEVLWRGHTHWTMLLAGGVCFTLIYLVDKYGRGSLFVKCAVSAALITAVEFCTGLIVNLWLGWEVWDYSALPMNLLGQVCPLFSLYWLALSVPALGFCRVLRLALFAEKRT